MPLYSVIMLLFAFTGGPICASTADTPTKCTTSPAVEGGIGTMTFYFRDRVDMSADKFIAYVIRAGDTANVLQCDRKKPPDIECDVINKAFEPTSIVNHSLTLTAPDVTPNLAGNYTLWTYVDGSREPRVDCEFLVVKDDPGGMSDTDIIAIVVPIVCTLLLILFIAIYIIYKRRKSEKPDPEDPKKPSNLELSENNAASPMLPSDQADGILSDVDRRWYFGNLSPEKEAELPHFRRNGPGSFLIREESPKYRILAVCGEDHENKRFRVLQSETETGFKISGAKDTFNSLSELVNHYRNNDMIIDGQSFGKLGKPFEEKPTGEWYAGKLSRRKEKRMLKGTESGSFLIRDNITFPGFYTLAVNVGGKTKTKHFRISLDENCFIFGDANKSFKSLSELVSYYTEKDIVTDEGNFGKLVKPVQAQQTSCPCM